MNKSMELFGQAICDRLNNINEPFYFVVNGVKEERNIDRYLRKPDELNDFELFMIDQCYGRILDVGCGTGNYIPVLSKKGETLGIDVSKTVIEAANKMGNKECVVSDVFNIKPDTKYDTITFFENNFGMAFDDNLVIKLLSNLKRLLKTDGQILLMQRDIVSPEIVVNTVGIEYKKEAGSFKWAQTNQAYVKKRFESNGFNFEILKSGKLDEEPWYIAVCRLSE